MPDYVPVYSRRERRFRNLGKVLFLAAVLLVVFFLLSLKVSILDNNLTWKWVELENNEGDTINALLLYPEETSVGGAPAVIVTHDLAGHKEQLNRLSFELARQGFVVMAVDLRDHGTSSGTTTYDDYYTGEAYDLIAAYNYLAREADYVDPERIGFVGDGFGGAACLMANNILLESNQTVGAVVAWAPPMDITGLFNENWDEVRPYIDRRNGQVQWDYAPDRDNRSAALHMDAPNWTAGDVYIIYGAQDQKVPVSQFSDLQDKAELYEMADLDHDLSENHEVLEYTIDFLYRKLEKEPRVEYDFNYEEVETANLLVNIASVAVMVFAFFMVYEVLVMKKSSRAYISQYSRDVKPMLIGIATFIDVVVYVAVASIVGAAYDRISGEQLMEIIPAAQFYITMLFAGALLLVVGMGVWYVWSYLMPRDEERTEETCGNLRGIAAGLLGLIIVVINMFFGQILLSGSVYPKDLGFILATAFALVFFLGHELWVRKLLYMKVNALLSRLFLRHRWPYHLVLFGVMYGLYALLSLVMMWNLGRDHFDVDFTMAYGLFISVIGLVSTLIYHRSKSILASVTYSTVIAPWLLTYAHHL